MEAEVLATSVLGTPIGPFYLSATALGLSYASFVAPKSSARSENNTADGAKEHVEAAKTFIDVARTQVTDYFAGKRREFDLKFDQRGTPFQKRVWAELNRIPYGETISYRELADRVGKPGASRAVGNANGRNPLCLIVPCHRVIAADGGLGGYTGGVPIKERLLSFENPRRDLARRDGRVPAGGQLGGLEQAEFNAGGHDVRVPLDAGRIGK